MWNSNDVIEIDTYVIFNTLQNFDFQEHFIFVYQLKVSECFMVNFAK